MMFVSNDEKDAEKPSISPIIAFREPCYDSVEPEFEQGAQEIERDKDTACPDETLMVVVVFCKFHRSVLFTATSLMVTVGKPRIHIPEYPPVRE